MISMRLAVPAINNAGVDAGISDRFSDCKFFAIVNVDGDRINKDFESIPVPAGDDTGKLVFRLLGKGVQAVVAKALTERERQMIAGTGMKAYVGATGTVWDAVRSYIDERLEDVSELNPCEGESHCHG
jgi:predicted Fe-Mo cluster-binding NifX family protein